MRDLSKRDPHNRIIWYKIFYRGISQMGHNSYLKSENTYAREFLCGQMKLIFTMKYYAIASLISSRLDCIIERIICGRNVVANEAERKGRLDYARLHPTEAKRESSIMHHCFQALRLIRIRVIVWFRLPMSLPMRAHIYMRLTINYTVCAVYRNTTALSARTITRVYYYL